MKLLKKAQYVFLIILIFTVNHSLGEQRGEHKKILVLFSFRPSLPVALQWDRGIRSVLETSETEKILINIEYLDLSHLGDEKQIQLLSNLLRHKYSRLKPDLIISVLNSSVDFVLNFGGDLFPGVPVVFGGVEKRFIDSRSLQPNMTGYTTDMNYKGTLDLALGLHPNTRHIAVVAGEGPFTEKWYKSCRKSYKSYEDRFDFIYLKGFPLETILERVKHLPPETIVMALPVLIDGAGKEFVGNESLSLITQASNAPVYSFWDVTIGTGIIGGYVINYEMEAEAVALLGLRVLNGEKPEDIPIVQAPKSSPMIDWRQLKRWSIPENRLPSGSIVKFKEITAWDRYKWHIIGLFIVVLSQTLVIFYFLYQRRIRLLTERNLSEQLEFEQLIADLSSRFTRLPTERLESEILEGLARIGTQMGSDRTFLFRFNWDRTRLIISHLWESEIVAKDQTVRGANVKDLFPWLYRKLNNNQNIIVPDVKTLPALEAFNEYKYCLKFGIRSFIILPIQVVEAPLCAIGLDAIRNPKEWSPKDEERLRLIGEIVANAIERKHSETRSKAAEQKYRTVVDYTYDWEYWQNPDGSLEYVSPSCEDISGHRAQEFIENSSLLQEIVVPDDKEIWKEHHCSNEADVNKEGIQFRIQKPDGGIRWIEHICRPILDSQGGNRGIRASNRDVTIRKESELEVARLKNMLEAESTYLQEEIEYEHNFKNIIGQSEELNYVLHRAEQVASTELPALILGETGTGKELVARAIHRLSSRNKRALVKVNCAALSPTLMESELFGHEKGAFTGAVNSQIGRFEFAARSSLFLDEIGEIPLDLQAKLLQVLEGGEFERLGNPRTLTSDARIIAATNRNLKKEVANGRFREDLLYRLNVFTITLPQLRKRKDDIPLLVQWFVSQFSKGMGTPAPVISKGTIEAMKNYHWPGNVRELKHTVESALISTHGKRLVFEIPKTSENRNISIVPFKEMEHDYILKVLKARNWKIGGTNSAASALDMHVNTLRARMKKLGIKKPEA